MLAVYLLCNQTFLNEKIKNFSPISETLKSSGKRFQRIKNLMKLSFFPNAISLLRNDAQHLSRSLGCRYWHRLMF